MKRNTEHAQGHSLGHFLSLSMAARSRSRAIDQLEKEVTCNICFSLYTQPRQLKCSHVYCQSCIDRLEGKPRVSCPCCRDVTELPLVGAAGLQSAFSMNSLLEIFTDLKKSSDNEKGSAEDPNNDNISNCQCLTHSRISELYCETCSHLICFECVIQDGMHKTHEYEKLKNAFEKYKTATLNPLEKWVSTAGHALKQIELRYEQVSHQKAAIESKIQETMRQLHKVLENREFELIQQLNATTKGKLSDLEFEKGKVETMRSKLSSSLEGLKASLEKCSQIDAMVMKASVKTLVEEAAIQFPQESYEPSTEADMLFSTSAKVIEMINGYGSIATPDSRDHSPKNESTDEDSSDSSKPISPLSTIPFCNKIEEYPFDENGRTVTINEVSITIPPGAIPSKTTACIELGVALSGPFSFPDDYQPVSPIIWLCVRGADLRVPVAITLPHVVTDVDKVALSFAKADHRKYTYDVVTGQDVYNFRQLLDYESKKFTNPTEEDCGYGILRVKHCCLYCSIAKISPVLARSKGYCLTTLTKEMSPTTYRIIHVCTYFLKECFRALKENYPEEEYQRFSTRKFQFGDENNMQLVITATCKPLDNIQLAPECGNMIKANDVDFWTTDYTDLQLMQDQNIYPPARPFTVHSLISPVAVEITFEVKIAGSESFILTILRQFNNSGIPAAQLQQETEGTLVKSADVSFLCGCLHKYSYKWREIGQALNFENGELETISHKVMGSDPQQLLTELLSQWSQWPTTDHHDAYPTMESLRDALRSGQVGLGAEANDIYKLKGCLQSKQCQRSSSLPNTSYQQHPAAAFNSLPASFSRPPAQVQEGYSSFPDASHLYNRVPAPQAAQQPLTLQPYPLHYQTPVAYYFPHPSVPAQPSLYTQPQFYHPAAPPATPYAYPPPPQGSLFSPPTYPGQQQRTPPHP